jgi:hypothetical protein
VPHTYWIQMQMQLEVAGLEVCHFWDNNFAEYPNAKAFEDDAHGTEPGLNTAGKERGVLVETRVLGSSDFAYRYAAIGLSHAELQAWVDTQLGEIEADPGLEAHKVTYWRLVHNELAVVKRDRGWFLDVLPRLRAVWGTILYYRNGERHRELAYQNRRRVVDLTRFLPSGTGSTKPVLQSASTCSSTTSSTGTCAPSASRSRSPRPSGRARPGSPSPNPSSKTRNRSGS